MHRLNDNTLRLAHRYSSWYNHNMLQTAQAMEYGMLKHCESCSCGATVVPLYDEPEWRALQARGAETDREIEAMFAEAERLLAEGSHAE